MNQMRTFVAYTNTLEKRRFCRDPFTALLHTLCDWAWCGIGVIRVLLSMWAAVSTRFYAMSRGIAAQWLPFWCM